MKKNISYLLLSLIFFLATGAQAQELCKKETCCTPGTKYFAKFLVGNNFLQSTSITSNKASYQMGYIVAGSLAYRWCYGLSLEGEYAYKRNAIRKIHLFGEGTSNHGHFQTSSYMANLLWDLPLAAWGCAFWNIQPFVGAGIGYDFQKMHASTSRIEFNQKWNQFSWQLMAGLAFPIYCNTDITLEYKYHQSGCHFYNNSIGLGIVYKFDCLRWR